MDDMPDMQKTAPVPRLMSSPSWIKLWPEPVYSELTVGRKYKSSWETSVWHRSYFCSGDILIQLCPWSKYHYIKNWLDSTSNEYWQIWRSLFWTTDIRGLLFYVYGTLQEGDSVLRQTVYKIKYMLVRFQKKGWLLFTACGNLLNNASFCQQLYSNQ